MQAVGDVLRTVDQEIHLGWRHIRSWAEGVFTKERIANIALLSSIVAILAAVLFSLYRAVQSNTSVDISPYLSSLSWRPPVPGY